MAKIHRLADVAPGAKIGEDTRVWQFAVILDGARIGSGCNVCAHTFIEGNVVIGNDVTIKSGVYVWDGTRIGDSVFLGPNATLTNDRMPRSKVYPERFDGITIENGASIGANATILPGLTIGEGALVGAGAVVTRDVPPGVIVAGNPARILRKIQE
ncbi:acyltransferase [Aliihoeflea sp. PC F10.4]